MALSLRPNAASSPCSSGRPSLLPHYTLHRARVHLLGPTVSSVCGLCSSSSSVEAPLNHYSLFFSASLGRKRRNISWSGRSRKVVGEQTRQVSLRLLCSSLQGGPLAEGPITEDRKGPQLQWILLVGGVAAAGVALFLSLKRGGLSNAGQALALQVDPTLAATVSSEAPARFTVKLPGLGSLSLGEVTPGWVYFLLLMAAGFGLFVSEEALNVWVGASLGRLLTYRSRESFLASLSENTPFIISTVLWVYWGVCISDMVPFYAGKLASRTGDQLSQKLGVSKEKYEQVRGSIQRYGNLIGFVERFSIGVRNPTAFLAGVAGISPAKFFGGVCVGALFTLPIQMSIGFMLRERPVAALAGVAAVVGTWTLFPYAAAGTASLYYLVRRNIEKHSQ